MKTWGTVLILIALIIGSCQHREGPPLTDEVVVIAERAPVVTIQTGRPPAAYFECCFKLDGELLEAKFIPDRAIHQWIHYPLIVDGKQDWHWLECGIVGYDENGEARLDSSNNPVITWGDSTLAYLNRFGRVHTWWWFRLRQEE